MAGPKYGIPSPDLMDTLCFLFLEGVGYAPSGEEETSAAPASGVMAAALAAFPDDML